jgi:hypothetical protein
VVLRTSDPDCVIGKERRLIGEIEWYLGELVLRLGLIISDLSKNLAAMPG